MPHVVIEGELDLRAYAESFAHLRLAEPRDLLRTENVYLERSGRSLLIQALAVEAGRRQTFYVRISLHDRGSVSVRIDPLTKPERSEGVKRIVAALGADVVARMPGAKVRTTNLVLPSSCSPPGSAGPHSDGARSDGDSGGEGAGARGEGVQ
jgi:hypothetical protein